MRTSNGQIALPNGNYSESTKDSETCLPNGTVLKSLNPAEEEFISNLKFQGIDELIHSLKMIHDF